MTLSLDAMIARTKTAMKTEKDPDKLAALASDLAAYKKTKTHIEKHETEEGADDEDEDEEDSASESKGDETDRKSDDDSDSDSDDDSDSDSKDKDSDDDEDVDDDEEDEDDEEEDEAEASMAEEEEESAKSAALNVMAAASAAGVTSGVARKAIRQAVKTAVRTALVSSRAAKVYAIAKRVTGKRSASAIEATLKGQAVALRDARQQLGQLQKDARRSRRAALIAEALQARRISPSEARDLKTKRLSFVEQTLSMRRGPIVFDAKDDPVPPIGSGALPANVQAIVDGMVAEAKKRGVELDAKQVAADVQSRGQRNGRVI